ncbi:MAG: glycosyltransferase, partial [Kiritimatiellae bacterium]|nr:glycosyltransferase [Kiritimatiellia bacterium]
MRFWINTPFDTLPDEGGRPMRYWLLCRALVAAGHEVVLWSSDFHHVTKSRRTLVPIYESEHFQVRLVPTTYYKANIGPRRVYSHWNYARRWFRLAHHAVASGHVRTPDCVLVSLPPLDLYAAAARMRACWKCPVIVDVQDAWPETFYRLLPAGWHGLARLLAGPARYLARRAYQGADGVTAVSERYIRLAHEYGCQSRAEVFPLGCELKPSATTAETCRSMNRDAGISLCYVGNLGP